MGELMESDGRIQANAELWREDGHWRMSIKLPTWLIEDFLKDQHETYTAQEPFMCVTENMNDSTLLFTVEDPDDTEPIDRRITELLAEAN